MRASVYKIYSDGACTGNPGRGGWGALIRAPNGKEQELSQGYKYTTNNRMELRGVIEALSHTPETSTVQVTTDSQYVVNAVEKGWITSWLQKNWKNSQKKPVANRDLWEALIPLLAIRKVSFEWVRGHTGHTENERCDALAVAAYASPHLQDDVGFQGSLFG
jgi:ribonuclease HI